MIQDLFVKAKNKIVSWPYHGVFNWLLRGISYYFLFHLEIRHRIFPLRYASYRQSWTSGNYSVTLLSLATNKALAILYNDDRTLHDGQRGVLRRDGVMNPSPHSWMLRSITLPVYHYLTSPSQVVTSILVYPIGDFEVKKKQQKQMAWCFKSKTKRSATDWMDLVYVRRLVHLEQQVLVSPPL